MSIPVDMLGIAMIPKMISINNFLICVSFKLKFFVAKEANKTISSK